MMGALLNSGSVTHPSREEVAPASGQAETSAHKKLRKAAEEFEGILISKLLEEFKTGFSSIGGESPMAGSDTLNSWRFRRFPGRWRAEGDWESGKCCYTSWNPP